MNCTEEEEAHSSRRRAQFYLKKGKPGRAFSHFLVALQLMPSWKTELKLAFSTTLCTWGRRLESEGRYIDLFRCYEQAIEVFAENEGILNNLGAHLYRLGCLKEASSFFHRALFQNHSFLPALRNLESISNLEVERWHFRMLNNTCRNSAYRDAIKKRVQQGYDVVLDIGTGTGILSLFAVEAEAKAVHACDSSPTMISIAKQVMEGNNANTKVNLINKLSNDLSIPNDIPERVSLVVTETLDVGLLGEHILQTLVHAWDSLLLPSGVVIPLGATIWIAAIECDYVARRSRFVPCSTSSTSNLQSESLEFNNISFVALEDEPYDSHDLNTVPGGFRFLTCPIEAIHINFNDPQELKAYLKSDHEACKFSITCTSQGRVDALAAWFELELDEGITLSSSPQDKDNKACCWDQTVFPLQETLHVTEAKQLKVSITCSEGKLSVSLDLPQDEENKELCLSVSQEVVSFLNDEQWMTALNETAQTLLQCSHPEWKILDLSPFPVLGLTILKNSTQAHANSKKWDQLTCVVKDTKDEVAIRHVAEANGIDSAHIECIKEDSLADGLDGASCFDLIMVHLVSSSGVIKENFINQIPTLQKLLKDQGLLLPRLLSMSCKLIHSDWLAEVSSVLDPNRVCGYQLAQFINSYQVSEHLDFCVSSLDYEGISDVIEVMDIWCEQFESTVETPLTLKQKVLIKNTGHVNAIPYWFTMWLLGESTQVSTLHIASCANQTAVLINPAMSVTAGEHVELMLTCHQGLIHVGLEKHEE